MNQESDRGWNAGPELTPRIRAQGGQLLALIGGSTQWVHRKKETVKFVDGTTMSRQVSVDFTIPTSHEAHAQREDGEALYFIPLAIVRKTRLAHFDLRDEAGKAVPLLTRRRYGPLGAAILVALAYTIRGTAGLDPTRPIPRDLEHDLRVITNEDPLVALECYARLGSSQTGSDETIEWRSSVIANPRFMGLAFDLARGHLAAVPLPGPAGVRRIIKMSYEWQLNKPPRRRTPRVWLSGVRSSLHGDEVVRHGAGNDDAPTTPVGTLQVLFATTGRVLPDAKAPVVEFEIAGEDGTSIAARTGSGEVVTGVPVGSYEVRQTAVHGYLIVSPNPQKVVVNQGETARVIFENREEPRQVKPPSPAAEVLPRVSLAQRITRGMGLRSKTVIFPVRLGDGGSYHLDFEAPDGLKITRSKLVDDQGKLLDLVLGTSQTTHLSTGEFSRALVGVVHVNQRARGRAIVRAATITATFAAVVLGLFAVRWVVLGGPHVSNGAALLLAVPGALSAYASQPTEVNATSAATFGLRLMSLIPGFAAFWDAALLTVGAKWPISTALVVGIGAITALTAVVWCAVTWVTLRPPEQQPTRRAQGPSAPRPA